MSAARPRPLTRAALRAHPLPAVDSGDKNAHGRLLIIGGDRTTPGSVMIAANAALRAGCGKLVVATVDPLAPHVATELTSARVVGVPMARGGGFARSALGKLMELAQDQDAILAGPGLFEDKVCTELARRLAAANHPRLVFDAALLHGLPKHDDTVRDGAMPILLPHWGEMASLIGCTPEEVERDPLGCGRTCARRYGALTLVKGPVSHVVTPGGESWRFAGGVPGLGVSGSGDALAGIVGGLLARGCAPLTALLWGVLLHGEAGQALSRKIGPAGFLACELALEIPALMAR